MALARREGSLLLDHPGMWVGVALTLLGYLLVYNQDQGALLLKDGYLPLVLLAWATLITTNLAALRSRRDHTEELFDSLPTSAPARTAAHLLSVLVVVPIAVAIFAGWYLFWRAAPAGVGGVGLAPVAGLLLIVLGAGVSGVLVARWVPTPLGGPLAVIATVVLQSNLWYQDDRWRWLHFAPGDAYDTPFDIGHHGWHVVYLCGLVLLGAVLAMGRHGIDRRVLVAGGTAVVVLVVSAWAQTRPPGADLVAARVAQLEDPPAHQVCEERAGVRYCAYPDYQGWIPLWETPVQGVLARVPASGRPRALEVGQRAILSTHRDLLPAVKARLDPSRAWVADGIVHPGLDWYLDDHQLGLGFQTAALAVGLPPAAAWPGPACSAGGQARVVVALWLAGHATPRAEALLRRRAAQVEREGPRALAGLRPLDVLPDYDQQDSSAEPDYLPEVGAAGRGADVVAAARLLDQPDDRVAAVVSEQWARLVDPATPASAVFGFVGIPAPAGIADLAPVTPGVGRSCR